MADPEEPRPEATEGDSGACTHETLTETRVAEVVELMLRGKFRRGSTVRGLAQKWGVGEQRAREITALASKRVRASLTDPDELAAEVVPAMLSALHSAVKEGDARGVAALGGAGQRHRPAGRGPHGRGSGGARAEPLGAAGAGRPGQPVKRR